MTDYEVLGVSAHNTDDEIFAAYTSKKELAASQVEKNRIELAYRRLNSIKTEIPCPKATEENKIYGSGSLRL